MTICPRPQSRTVPALAVAVALAALGLQAMPSPALAAAAAPSAEVPSTPLVAMLRAAALPLSLDAGRLSGPGADWISEASVNTQFVLVGEDHGMAEAPAVASAMWSAQLGGAFDQLVIETGPQAAAEIETALRADADGLARLMARYPTAIPFFGWREDGALAATAVAGGAAPRLCGVDQEFILGGRQLFRRLAAMASTPAAADVANGFAERDEALYAEMVEKRDPDAALLPRLQASDVARLERAFAGQAEALALIADLAASAEIYRLQSTDPGRSNAQRIALMKRNLMRCLARVSEPAKPPRALFRLGAFHAGRGRSPLGLFDLGNLASELAESRGQRSLHLLVIAAGGEVNRWYPFAGDEAARQAAYDARKELGVIGALPVLDAADPRTWVLIPLAPLRSKGALRRSGGEQFDHLVFGYDAVIVVPAARATTDYTVD